MEVAFPLAPATMPAATDDFSDLFSQQFAFVWGSLRRLGVQERDVEDVAQDVFLKVHAKFDVFDRARPVRPWLFAFAVRAAADYRRLARHRVERLGPESEAERPSLAKGADRQLEEFEERSLVEEALNAVPLDRRAVLIAFELDEVPMKEVATALEIPLHTAYSRLRVGREEFAAAIRRLRAPRTAGRAAT